jgi:hypothetical protein
MVALTVMVLLLQPREAEQNTPQMTMVEALTANGAVVAVLV